MNIQYGEKETIMDDGTGQSILIQKFDDGKAVVTHHNYRIREKVKDDSEELSKFIQLQREHKGSSFLSFTREVSDRGNRFVIKEWRD